MANSQLPEYLYAKIWLVGLRQSEVISIPVNLLLSALCMLTAILVSALGLLCAVHYRTASAKALMLLLLTSGIYSFAYAFEVLRGDPAWIWFWLRIEYIGIAPIGAGWLWLALNYTGSRLVQRRSVRALLTGVPTVFFLLMQTNRLHHLFYRSLLVTHAGPYAAAQIERGPAYLALIVWQLIAFALGLLIYWRHHLRTSPAFKRQSLFMLLGSVIPIAYSTVYYTDLIPWNIDGTPIVIGLTSCLFAWAILKGGLLDVSPIARERIFSSMQDGVIVTDSQGYIVDFNPAAAAFLPNLLHQSVGKLVVTALPQLARFAETEGAQQSDRQPLLIADRGGEQVYDVWRVGINSGHAQVGHAWYVRRITEQHRLFQELQQYATRDALTGIYNRRRWEELSREMLQRADQENVPLALLWIDIDHFKQINDRFGHATGDLLLTDMARLVTGCLPSGAVFGRIGGEEFAITLLGVSVSAASELAGRVLHAIAEHVFRYAEIPPLTVTVSIGVGMRGSGTGESLQQVTHKADIAMYHAKQHGRNQVKICED